MSFAWSGFRAVDRALDAVAPAINPARASHNEVQQNLAGNAAAAGQPFQATAFNAPAPAPVPTPVAATPTAPQIITLPAAAAPKKRKIEVGDAEAARLAGAAGLTSGDTGLVLDPLGRRGRGAVGHTTLLGR